MSLFGPENLPPLEAMALGCPVVAADVPGAREQLGDAALRVPPIDAAARRRRGPLARGRRPSASGWSRPAAARAGSARRTTTSAACSSSSTSSSARRGWADERIDRLRRRGGGRASVGGLPPSSTACGCSSAAPRRRGARRSAPTSVARPSSRSSPSSARTGSSSSSSQRVPIENDVFVEFGVEDYSESNTRFLLVHDNWRGLIIDGARRARALPRSATGLGWRHQIDARHRLHRPRQHQRA